MSFAPKPKLLSEVNPFFGKLLSGIRSGAITAENADTVAVVGAAPSLPLAPALQRASSSSTSSGGAAPGGEDKPSGAAGGPGDAGAGAGAGAGSVPAGAAPAPPPSASAGGAAAGSTAQASAAPVVGSSGVGAPGVSGLGAQVVAQLYGHPPSSGASGGAEARHVVLGVCLAPSHALSSSPSGALSSASCLLSRRVISCTLCGFDCPLVPRPPPPHMHAR